MAFAQSGGLQIYYEIHGEDGPAVALIHGSGGNHAAWWQQVPYLSRKYRVVTLDLRGFGNSARGLEDFDALQFPTDILAVLDAAQFDRVALVGQSVGAAAALQLAVGQPERVSGVVLAHSVGGIAHEELGELVRADRARAQELPVLDRLMTKPFQTERPEMTFLFRQLGTLNRARMPDLRNVNAGGPALEQLGEANVRIAFLTGEEDVVLGPATVRRAHELVPGSLLEVVPGAPHSMYWETPDLFNRAVDRLLGQIYGI